MSTSNSRSSSTSATSKKETSSLVSSAQRVKADRLRKAVSMLNDETDFYCSSVTELAVQLAALLEVLQDLSEDAPWMREFVASHTSRYHQSLKNLLSFYPQSTISARRLYAVLTSDGLEKVLPYTPGEWPSLSSDLIIENVARSIGHTKNSVSQSPSPDSIATTPSHSHGTSGLAVAAS